MRGHKLKCLRGTDIEVLVFLHQGAAKGIFNLLAAPQLRRFLGFFSEHRAQTFLDAEWIDERSVDVEGEHGSAQWIGHGIPRRDSIKATRGDENREIRASGFFPSSAW